MPSEFITALCSNARNERIPEEYDFFGGLIVPSREERLHDKQPDAEYGTTIRIFNPKTMVWDIFYGCMGEAIRLTARKVDDDIILTENTTKKMRYVFSDIVDSYFLWRKERMNEKGEWKTVAKVTADRK